MTNPPDGIPPITAAPDGSVDVGAYMKRTFALLGQSKLKGFKPKDGDDFGIAQGTTREWTILLTANTKQESDFNIKEVSDQDKGFPGGGSFGLGQMSPGDGKGSWGDGLTETVADIEDPSKATIAIVKAHEFYILEDGVITSGSPPWKGIARLNGSYRRPQETTQHLDFARKSADKYLPK